MAACDSRVYPLCTREDRHHAIPPFDNGPRLLRAVLHRTADGHACAEGRYHGNRRQVCASVAGRPGCLDLPEGIFIRWLESEAPRQSTLLNRTRWVPSGSRYMARQLILPLRGLFSMLAI